MPTPPDHDPADRPDPNLQRAAEKLKHALDSADMAELEWWREFRKRVMPDSLEWVRVGRPLLGHHLVIRDVTEDRIERQSLEQVIAEREQARRGERCLSCWALFTAEPHPHCKTPDDHTAIRASKPDPLACEECGSTGPEGCPGIARPPEGCRYALLHIPPQERFITGRRR